MSGINRAVSALNDATVQISTAMTDRLGGALVELYRGRVSERVRGVVNGANDVDRRNALNRLATKDSFRDPAIAAAGLNARIPSGSGTGYDLDFDWFNPSSATRVNREIDDCLHRVNPGYDKDDPNWRRNCSAVTIAYELRRRGLNVEAGPVADTLIKGIEGNHSSLAWAQGWVKTGINGLYHAFRRPGWRGMVAIRYITGEGHMINAEHVPETGLRFVDGQPNPPLTDATSRLKYAGAIWFRRLDDVEEIPPRSILEDLGIRFLD
ncbi:hypothetical protein [Nocardia sp. NPDC049149]|uniref:hypothetical protein n=1 Tax=Nocardia sp. NPDC049149 TaxID=3364315 RepID=UPI0037245300